MAFTAQHVYEFYSYTPKQGSTVYWRIDDITAATSQTGTVITHLPTNNVALQPGIGITTSVSTTRHKIDYQHIYVESDS